MLIDCFWFYAVSAIFQLHVCKGGWRCVINWKFAKGTYMFLKHFLLNCIWNSSPCIVIVCSVIYLVFFFKTYCPSLLYWEAVRCLISVKWGSLLCILLLHSTYIFSINTIFKKGVLYLFLSLYILFTTMRAHDAFIMAPLLLVRRNKLCIPATDLPKFFTLCCTLCCVP